MARLAFWYEFASTYSYLSAMRIERLAAGAGVTIDWRPFLLGPIFAAQGWTTSPFNLYPVKGRYMVRDVERLAEERGLKFTLPARFPANSLKAARVALRGVAEGWAGPFTRSVYVAQFSEQRDISDVGVLSDLLARVGLDAAAVLAASEDAANKERLKANTQEAQALGVFGAPSFVAADGELFWGDDRLERAVAWATRTSGDRELLP